MDGYQDEVPAVTMDHDERPLNRLTMDRLVANRAAAFGDETFIHYGPTDQAVSFQELAAVSNAIGNGLRDLGVAHEDKVSVLVRNPLETVFAMFGIHAAGAVYAPINFEYRGDALSYQLNDTAPEILVLEDQYADRLNAVRHNLNALPHVVLLETDAHSEALDSAFDVTPLARLKEQEQTLPPVETAWNDQASIIYTSGTTGMPKGVVIPQRWILGNYVIQTSQLLNDEDVVHTVVPMYHVAGVYMRITAALVTGASVALWDRFSASAFWDRIELYGATNAGLLSVMVPWLMDQPESPDDHRNPLKIVTMQPLPENYDEIAERYGFDFVKVGYGQTETGTPITGLIHATPGGTPKELWKGKAAENIIADVEALGIPVVDGVPAERFMGRKMPFVEVAVLNEDDERVPPGETGELAVRPKQPSLVLEAYYNKPDRTAAAMRNLWFHTGDAVYRDEADYFYFVDRIGDVIRRRGENISSMQIQDAITAHESVSKAAVFPIPAAEGGEDEIGAAIEPVHLAGFSQSKLEDYLEERLAPFMLPDRLEVFEEFPTTETSKIEKYKLRDRMRNG